jgi:hypothetical protein
MGFRQQEDGKTQKGMHVIIEMVPIILANSLHCRYPYHICISFQYAPVAAIYIRFIPPPPLLSIFHVGTWAHQLATSMGPDAGTTLFSAVRIVSCTIFFCKELVYIIFLLTRHCATHQIRVILISCVVITSLFYPALDLYTSSRNSSQSILDAFISPHANANLKSPNDLVNLWSGQDTLRVHEDPVTRAKCRDGHALRIERIFIQSPLVEDDGALNHEILLSALDLERRIQQLIFTGDFPCLKKSNGQCLVLSPLAFWNYDKNALTSDSNILDTLSYSKNVSVSGFPVTPHMVLAGRGSYEHHVGGNKFDYATFLALTYFFPNSACWGSVTEYTQWVQTVQNAVAHHAEVAFQVPEPILIALEVGSCRNFHSKSSILNSSPFAV